MHYIAVRQSIFHLARDSLRAQAASLSMENEFKSGRLLAYQLMCAMTMRRRDAPLSAEYLTHFYRLMHIGLTGTDQVSSEQQHQQRSHDHSLICPLHPIHPCRIRTVTAGLHVRRNHKHKHKPRVNRDDTNTSARKSRSASLFLALVLDELMLLEITLIETNLFW